MATSRNAIISLLSVLTFSIAPALAAGAGPPSGLNVLVVNPQTNPVPVSIGGTSSVTGSVAITNTSANPVPVTGSLGISGGVTINNTATAPIPVAPVGKPFEAFLFCAFGTDSGRHITSLDGSLTACTAGVDVPAHQRATIEYVTFDCGATVGGPQELSDATIITTAGNFSPGSSGVPHTLPFDNLRGSQLVRFYADPQTPINLLLQTIVANPVVGCGISLSGQMFDAP